MAKLSAHGYEVARVTIGSERATDQRERDLYGEDHTVVRYEHSYSFRSDGHILARVVCLDVHPGESNPSRRRHDYGWKLWRKVRKGHPDPVGTVRGLAVQLADKARERGTLIDSTL